MEALSLNLAERRVACDGEAYTFKEYVDFYGFNALSRWQTSSAEQPVDTIVGQSESKRKGPVGTGDSPCPGMTPNDPQGPTAARQGHPSMTIINNKKHRSELDRCSCKIAQPLLDRMIPGDELRRCFECVKPVGPPVEPVNRPTGPQDSPATSHCDALHDNSRCQANSAAQPVYTIVSQSESHAEKPGDINSAAQPVAHLTPEERAWLSESVLLQSHLTSQSEASIRIRGELNFKNQKQGRPLLGKEGVTPSPAKLQWDAYNAQFRGLAASRFRGDTPSADGLSSQCG